jgi:hypothetical protein
MCTMPKPGGCISCNPNYRPDSAYIGCIGVYTDPKSGWICPLCGTANAPWLPYCNCKNTQKKDNVNAT